MGTKFSVFCAHRSLPCIDHLCVFCQFTLALFGEWGLLCHSWSGWGDSLWGPSNALSGPSLIFFFVPALITNSSILAHGNAFSCSWSPLWSESKNKLLSLCMESWVSNYCHVKFSLYRSVFVEGLDTLENGGLYKMYVFYTIYELYWD